MLKDYLLLSISLLGTSSSMAMVSSLDLEGNGRLTPVKLPFDYYKRQENDHLTLILQSAYKVYDIEKNINDVAVIGPLNPCIGITVTDGKKLLTFHKHSTSSLESMKDVIIKNLNMADKENLHARIYTTRDDLDWNQKNRQLIHGGKTHSQEVKEIKDFLERMGIIREQIPASLQPLRNSKTNEYIHAELSLGRYEFAECSISVRLNDVFEWSKDAKKQIKFSSIDPFTEDVFGYKGTQITEAEYFGPNLPQAQKTYPTLDFSKRFMSYDQLPQDWLQESGQEDGYRLQRGICERRMAREEDDHYIKYFGKNSQQFFLVKEENLIAKTYNSFPFYPIQ